MVWRVAYSNLLCVLIATAKERDNFQNEVDESRVSLTELFMQGWLSNVVVAHLQIIEGEDTLT